MYIFLCHFLYIFFNLHPFQLTVQSYDNCLQDNREE